MVDNVLSFCDNTSSFIALSKAKRCANQVEGTNLSQSPVSGAMCPTTPLRSAISNNVDIVRDTHLTLLSHAGKIQQRPVIDLMAGPATWAS